MPRTKTTKAGMASKKRTVKVAETIVEAYSTGENTSTALDNKIYFREKEITIFNDDILITKKVESNSIDLMITSPPYNVDVHYNSHTDD